jgi:hypothetical protein
VRIVLNAEAASVEEADTLAKQRGFKKDTRTPRGVRVSVDKPAALRIRKVQCL